MATEEKTAIQFCCQPAPLTLRLIVVGYLSGDQFHFSYALYGDCQKRLNNFIIKSKAVNVIVQYKLF